MTLESWRCPRENTHVHSSLGIRISLVILRTTTPGLPTLIQCVAQSNLPWQYGETYPELPIRHSLLLGSVVPLFAIVVPTASHNNEVAVASIVFIQRKMTPTVPGFTPNIAATLIRWRWKLLVIACLLMVICIGPAARLDFDRTLDSMFATDDPLMAPYRRMQELFGKNGIVLAVYDDPNFFAANLEGIQRLIEIRRRLAQVPGVHSTIALDSFLSEDERLVDENGVGFRLRQLFEGFTHGADERTVSVACMLTPEVSAGEGRDEVIARLREVIEDLPDGVLAGEPVMMTDAFAYIEQDGHRLFIASTVLLGLVILFLFRSIRWVLIPIAVVQLALLMTKALLTACNIQLTMVN